MAIMSITMMEMMLILWWYDSSGSYSDDYENSNDKDYNGNDNSHNDDRQTLIVHTLIHGWYLDLGFG